MGLVRTPRPEYFDGGVVEFFVKDGITYYKTFIWIKDGMTRFEFETGKYDKVITPIESIKERALHSFSTVSKN